MVVSKKDIKKFVLDSSYYIRDGEIDIVACFKQAIDNNEENALKYKESLVQVKEDLLNDIDFFYESDPAIDSKEEIAITYPGFLALSYYRIAHELRKLGYNLISRIITEFAHSKTGIDIHPGATISSPIFIDHGTGIVIGETAIIGKRVKLYQGVTLGALSLSRGIKLKGTKRHPTVGDDVTIYAGASILGDIIIGDDVTIGSNVFLLDSVPSHHKVYLSKPELIFKEKE